MTMVGCMNSGSPPLLDSPSAQVFFSPRMKWYSISYDESFIKYLWICSEFLVSVFELELALTLSIIDFLYLYTYDFPIANKRFYNCHDFVVVYCQLQLLPSKQIGFFSIAISCCSGESFSCGFVRGMWN